MSSEKETHTKEMYTKESFNENDELYERLDSYFPIRNTKELIACIKENVDLVLLWIGDDESDNPDSVCSINTTQNQIQALKNQLDDMKDQNEKQKELLNIKKKTESTHSMYKGLFEEKRIECFLNEYFGDHFDIDHENKNKQMDIIMTHKTEKYVIGVECKNKKKITKCDIHKFKRDKLNNNFKGSVFISSDAPIPFESQNKSNMSKDVRCLLDPNHSGVQKNTYWIDKDEIYIHSNDNFLIYIFIRNFIMNITSKPCEIETKYHIDTVCELYRHWTDMKKMFCKSDRVFIKYLKRMELFGSLSKGHLYVTPKSHCKNEKPPY